MVVPSLFRVERDANTLIVVPLSSVSSFSDEEVQAELESFVSQLQDPQIENVIVDFHATEYLTTSMVATMQTIWQAVCGARGKMTLCNVSGPGREVLKLVKLETRWPIFPSREKALKAIRK